MKKTPVQIYIRDARKFMRHFALLWRRSESWRKKSNALMAAKDFRDLSHWVKRNASSDQPSYVPVDVPPCND